MFIVYADYLRCIGNRDIFHRYLKINKLCARPHNMPRPCTLHAAACGPAPADTPLMPATPSAPYFQ